MMKSTVYTIMSNDKFSIQNRSMKYSFITPRPSPVVPACVVAAREELGRAMKTGNTIAIDKAYAHLESAERMAKLRRTSAHHVRAVVQILAVDPMWERMVAAVESFRK